MIPRTERQGLRDALVEALDDLDGPALRAVRTYVEQRLDDLRPTLSEIVRSKTGSEVVDITNGGPDALVREYRTSGDGSGVGRRTLSLPGGTREAAERRGETPLVVPRRVTESAGVECGNCGVPPDDSTTTCPRCGEERSRDGEA